MSVSNQKRPFQMRHRPYFIAVALAFVMTILVAPEVQENNAMEPGVKEGGLVVLQKKTYSEKRGLPSIGEVIVLDKNILSETEEDNALRRVVALAGDEVSVKNGQILVNEVKVKEYHSKELEGYSIDLVVPENKFFFISDNDNTAINKDSVSSYFGVMALEKIKGKAVLKLWPLTNIGVVK